MKAPVSRKKKNFQSPRVVFQPQVARRIQSGFNQLVDVIRPTLGPLHRNVANEHTAGRSRRPELLDSGGTIARRIIQISDRDEDVGLMYLRHVLWKLQENEGDGTATAAVIFQTVYNLGLRYVAAGGNAMVLRQHLETGMRRILATLDESVTELSGKNALIGLANTICYDEELARMLGEIFDIIGIYGRLEVRKDSGKELVREYVEGMYWDQGMRSRTMANTNHGLRANLENAAILISDLAVEDPNELVPLLNLCIEHQTKQLLLVTSTLSEKAMGLLLTKANQEKVHVVAVKTPGLDINVQREALEDLATLTGGRPLYKITADPISSVKWEDLGRARRIWIDTNAFGIVGGRGNPRVLRQHIARLREAFRESNQPAERKRILERLGKLIGGSATLFVGGLSPTHIENRVDLAQRTADAMRGAMRDGVVPGGGLALLHCRQKLQEDLQKSTDQDARAAYRILIQACEVPFRAIVSNAGYSAGEILAEIEREGSDCSFDVLHGRLVNIHTSGIYDSAAVVKAAARSAISGAALCLTTDVIIHRKNPPESIQT